MSRKDICPRIGASIVPRWFLDVLHAVIYADGQDGYFTILALSAMIDARSPGDLAILTEWARGFSQTKIAANLRMSRHRICRRMNAMRRRLGCATLRRLRGNQTAAEAFSLFAFGHCNETPDVRLVIDRLAELSPVELSVLSAILRFLPENETLASAGMHISASRASASMPTLRVLLMFMVNLRRCSAGPVRSRSQPGCRECR